MNKVLQLVAHDHITFLKNRVKFLAEHGKHNTHILLHRTAEKIEYGEEGSDDSCNVSSIGVFESKSQSSVSR